MNVLLRATREEGISLALRLGKRFLTTENIAQQCSTQTRFVAIPSLARFSSAAQPAEDTPEGPPILIAQPRTDAGSSTSYKLRSSGRIPGVLFSLPGEETRLISFDAKHIGGHVHRLGRTGWAVNVFTVQLQDPEHPEAGTETYRALGRQVHMAADTDAIENVTLMYCPPDRRVRLNVPLRVFGEEVCPGIKAGGRINWIKRTIACIAAGDSIPPFFEVDISQLEMNEKIYYTDLEVPEGVQLVQTALDEPIIKIRK